MTLLGQIVSGFYDIRNRVKISNIEADLYLYLVNEGVARSQEGVYMELSNFQICGVLGITEKTLIDARNRLIEKNLIWVVPGDRKKSSPIYTVLYLLLYWNFSSLSSSLTYSLKVSKKCIDYCSLYWNYSSLKVSLYSIYIYNTKSIDNTIRIVDSVDTMRNTTKQVKKDKNNIFIKKENSENQDEQIEVIIPEVIAEPIRKKRGGVPKTISLDSEPSEGELVHEEEAPEVDGTKYGDGVLYRECLQFNKDNPGMYPPEMYKKFLNHWTEREKNGKRREKWRIEKTWETAKRLAKWKSNNYGNSNFKTKPTNSDYAANVASELDDYFTRQKPI